MKKLVQIPVFIFFISTAWAQSGDLMIRNNATGFFLEHKVQPKEGLYPIGRLYNVNPKFLAAFNKWDMGKGLDIGQVINIPLTDTNFIQSGFRGVPVYYRVGEKEGIQAVSNKINKVSTDLLKNWNDLSADQLTAGKKLIVGFLLTNEMHDRVVTIQPKKKADPVTEEKKQETAEVKKPEPVTEKKEVVTQNTPAQTQPSRTAAEEKFLVDKYGYFTPHFTEQAKSSPPVNDQTVTSSIFKTVSGWADSKFYLLINDVEPGTIVRITNPSNNKTVYAKVLYSMDKIRQNQGVDMRISDATASFLSIYETDKFILKVNY